MLASCPVAAEEGRYTWRHALVLITILMYLSQLTSYGYTLYGDLPDYFHPNALFRSMRPDIVLTKNDDIYIIELTCCSETNTKKSRRYKMEKYKDIENDCNRQFKNFQKIFIEITTLGLIMHNIKEIYRLFQKTKINVSRMINKCMEVAARASFYIYVRRNKAWTHPKTLKGNGNKNFYCLI